MEFIEGESPKGPMPLDEALRIARQIAEALEPAHEKGIAASALRIRRSVRSMSAKWVSGRLALADSRAMRTSATASGRRAISSQ